MRMIGENILGRVPPPKEHGGTGANGMGNPVRSNNKVTVRNAKTMFQTVTLDGTIVPVSAGTLLG